MLYWYMDGLDELMTPSIRFRLNPRKLKRLLTDLNCYSTNAQAIHMNIDYITEKGIIVSLTEEQASKLLKVSAKDMLEKRYG